MSPLAELIFEVFWSKIKYFIKIGWIIQNCKAPRAHKAWVGLGWLWHTKLCFTVSSAVKLAFIPEFWPKKKNLTEWWKASHINNFITQTRQKETDFYGCYKIFKYFKNLVLKGLISSAGRQIQPNFTNTVTFLKKTKACGIQYRSINTFFGHSFRGYLPLSVQYFLSF